LTVFLFLGSFGSWRRERLVMGRPSKYPFEVRERAERLARESQRPIANVVRDLGIHPETLRVWVHQAEVDEVSRRDRVSSVGREELSRLRRENRELRRANEILKAERVGSTGGRTRLAGGDRSGRCRGGEEEAAGVFGFGAAGVVDSLAAA
jgi:transposase